MPIGSTNRYARSLRRHSTDAETKLWRELRNRRLGGFKFRRQATVGYFVVDFLCAEKGMAPYDAYGLLSLAGDVRINRTFRPISPVKMMLSRDVLRQVETLYRT